MSIRSYTPAGLDFDGTTDNLLRSSDLVGNVNSKSGIFSTWLRLDGLNVGTTSHLYTVFGPGSADYRVYVRLMATNKLEFIAWNTSGSITLWLRSTGTYTISADWVHFLVSWNVATSTGHLYMNDTNEKSTVVMADATIDYTGERHNIGSLLTRQYLSGALSDLYFAPGQYLDFSVTANRRKFISAGGYPVDLGSDGSTPTGTAPRIYMPFEASDPAANEGSGGDFTVVGSPIGCEGPATNQLDSDTFYQFNHGRSGNHLGGGERWYECERCGFTFKESDTVIEEQTGRRVCTTGPTCIDPDVREWREEAFFIRGDEEV